MSQSGVSADLGNLYSMHPHDLSWFEAQQDFLHACKEKWIKTELIYSEEGHRFVFIQYRFNSGGEGIETRSGTEQQFLDDDDAVDSVIVKGSQLCDNFTNVSALLTFLSQNFVIVV